MKAAIKNARSVAKAFEYQWRRLHAHCLDLDSQHRLAWLREQFSKGQRGAKESAQTEIDIATFLVEAGFTVSFVKEAETRTADLECYFDHDRLFVEVTVIVPSQLDRAKEGSSMSGNPLHAEDHDFWKDGLVKRMLARMNEKASQLSDYCAPVVMALTLVHQEQRALSGKSNNRRMALDLQQVGGVMTTALARTPQLSGVLLTLWNIKPAEWRSTIRLSSVQVGERTCERNGSSQVRCFILNPAATYPIERAAQVAIQRVL